MEQERAVWHRNLQKKEEGRLVRLNKYISEGRSSAPEEKQTG
ncbi:MAG: hypothetical protein ACLR6B_08370 [Blautia sp.]